jgi:hypothetical protein
MTKIADSPLRTINPKLLTKFINRRVIIARIIYCNKADFRDVVFFKNFGYLASDVKHLYEKFLA